MLVSHGHYKPPVTCAHPEVISTPPQYSIEKDRMEDLDTLPYIPRCTANSEKGLGLFLGRQKRYLAEERKEIMNYVWWYIQSSTKAELIENRAAMMEKMKISE
jgi:hypothetical protein